MNGTLRAFLLIAVLGCGGLVAFVFLQFHKVVAAPLYGATFSPAYAAHLGLDPHAAYTAILDDLPIRQIRLPLQWDDIQPTASELELDETDWYMNEAAKRNVRVILAIGNKVPRWPECYTPDWAEALPQTEYETALLSYIDQVVIRYRTHSGLERWQIENESLFPFGNCQKTSSSLLRREVAHVRALDASHPIQLTVSGEQQVWASVAMQADVIGTSMYRRVALPNDWLITFPIPARWYSLQALSVSFFVNKVVISELQAEPWLTQDYRNYTVDQAAALFTPDQLVTYLTYAHRSGIKEISLWGVEWWYYLKQNGHPELWQTAQKYLSGN